jgi:ABC-type proline/glycine betaine transport system permease subunit
MCMGQYLIHWNIGAVAICHALVLSLTLGIACQRVEVHLVKQHAVYIAC